MEVVQDAEHYRKSKVQRRGLKPARGAHFDRAAILIGRGSRVPSGQEAEVNMQHTHCGRVHLYTYRASLVRWRTSQ